MQYSSKPFHYLIFIGRFQPFHLAHYQTVKMALEHAEHVIICLGSAQNERTLKNPFLASEREHMIRINFSEQQQSQLHFVPIIDVYNDEKWQKQVTEKVTALTGFGKKVGLIGHEKDNSSYYLHLFPEWLRVPVESLENAISATPLREAYYDGNILSHYFPDGTICFLTEFMKTESYQQLVIQHTSSY